MRTLKKLLSQHSNSLLTPHSIQQSDARHLKQDMGSQPQQSLKAARVQVTRRAIDAEGGRDSDTLEDVDEFFDQSDI